MGCCRTAVTNLLLRSEEFDTTWVHPDIISANTEIAPNGTLTADTITSVGGPDSVYQSVSVLASTIYTASVYVKLGTMYSSDYKIAVYNNSTPSFIAVDVTPSQAPNSSTWTRVTYTFTTPAGCTSVRWYPFRNTAGIDSSTAFLWGAQLEQSATANEYIPTAATINSAPRFDHNPTTGESLGLLVEEQRTNLLLRSEEFDNASWTQNGVTVTPNASQSPAGGTTADLVAVSSSGGSKSILCNIASLTVASNYTLSFYAKAGASSTVAAGLLSTTFLGLYNFTLTGAGSVSAAVAGVSAAITLVGNGWYRCQLTVTTTSVGATLLIYPNSTSNSIGDSIYLWGAQLEAGAFPTSYIPTTAAAVTRNADVASITGSAYSSWFTSANENTFYVEGIKTQANAPGGTFYCGSNNTLNAIVGGWIAYNATGAKPRVQSRHGSVRGDTQNNAADLSAGSLFKGVSCTSTDTFAAVSNGSLVASAATPVQIDWGTSLAIGWFPNGGYTGALNGHIRRLTFWPQRLADSTLQQITQ
jgi:hypothetical protein